MNKLITDTSATKMSEEKTMALSVLTEQSFFPEWKEKDGGMEIELMNNSAVYR